MHAIISLIPHLVASTVFFVFLAIGLALLIASRDRLVERFAELHFNLTQRPFDEEPVISVKVLVMMARTIGLMAIVIALAVAWLFVGSFFG